MMKIAYTSLADELTRLANANADALWPLESSDDADSAPCSIGAQTRIPSDDYYLGKCPCNDYNRCAACSSKRARHIRRNVAQMIATGSNYQSITLTVPHSGLSLYRQLRDLLAYLYKLKRSAAWKRSIRGGIYSIEVTRNSNGEWHPHIHILAEGSISETELLTVWGRLTGATRVKVKAVDTAEYRDVMEGYVSKAANASLLGDAETNREFCEARNRLRLKGTLGAFRGQPLIKRRGKPSLN